MVTDHAEFLESRGRSFAGVWLVADDYRIEDGTVIPVLAGNPVPSDFNLPNVRGYMPMSRTELPGEFAKLAGESEDKVLEFVRRYGLLGYSMAFRWLELLAAGRERLHNPQAKGDPVAWILSHAATVGLVMKLAEALNDLERLKLQLQQLTVRDERSVSEELLYVAAKRGYTHASQIRMRAFGDPRETALQIISHILNENLEGVSRELIIEHQETGKRGITSVFSPQNLLDCVYWHLADAVLGGTVRTCENPSCKRFFVATHKKMRYCPLPMGFEGVSRCMNAAKQRRLRTESRNKSARRRTRMAERTTERKGKKGKRRLRKP